MTASPLIPAVRSGRIKMRPYNEKGRQVRL